MQIRKYEIISPLVFSFLFFIAIASCGSEGKNNTAGISRTKPAICLIYCDLTASVDSSFISKMASYVDDYIQYLPPDSRFCIFPINCSFSEPIANGKVPGRPTKPSEEEVLIRRKKEIANAAAESIVKLHAQVFANNKSCCSCILEALEMARDYFSAFEMKTDSLHQYELLFFSDMLQDCISSTNDARINFFKLDYRSAHDKIQNYLPNIDISKARLTIVISARPMGQMPNEAMSPSDLKKLWREIFMKVGYTNDELTTWNFMASFPDVFKDTLYWKR